MESKSIMELITVQDEKSVFDILKQINAQDALKGSTPLMQAIEFNNSLKLIEALLSAGAKVGTKDFVGNTALHFAALEGRKDVIELLLHHGAEKGATNADGKKPADLADDPSIKKILS
jgi:ankyrin repeat protein